MDVMKHKLYIISAVVLLVAFGILIFMLSRGPVQAVDPRKDFSKTAKPSSQVLGDAYDQTQATNAERSVTAATPARSGVATAPTTSTSTATTTPSVAQNTVTPPINTDGEHENTGDKHQQSEKSSKQGVVDAVLNSLSNLRL